MVSLPFDTQSNPPTVRRPTFTINLGSDGADAWAETLLSLTAAVGLAPAVDAVKIQIADDARAPSVELGDSGSVELGYEDSSETLIFTGEVSAVEHNIRGATRITLTNSGSKLAGLRLDQSFQQQSAGAMVQSLLGEAGVSADVVEDGIEYPYYVVDSGRNVLQHMAELAKRDGFLAHLSPEDKFCFQPFTAGQAEISFHYGDDILVLQLASHNTAKSVTVTGEGAAGSEGSEAWSWLVKDPSAVQKTAGDGNGRSVSDPSLRSGAAVEKAAQALADGQSKLQLSGLLTVPGAPAVVVGSAIEIADAPQTGLNGLCLVRRLCHHYDKGEGFITTIWFARVGEGGLGGLI